MAEVCEAAGGDVTMLARAIGYDARIGNKFLRAGIGFGGGCLPKDIRAFQARAQELGAGEALRFLHEVDLINQRRRARVVQLAAELLGRDGRPGRPGPRGYPDRGAGRDVQAEHRRRAGLPGPVRCPQAVPGRADVIVYDPEGMENARRVAPDVTYVDNLTEAVAGRRPGLRAHRVGGVPQRRPGRAGPPRPDPSGHRRPQLPRPGAVDQRRLGVPRHGPLGGRATSKNAHRTGTATMSMGAEPASTLSLTHQKRHSST